MIAANNKPPSLQSLNKDMVSLDYSPSITPSQTVKKITVSTPPANVKPLLSVGEFILDTMAAGTGTGDGQTLEAKTVISKELSQKSRENSSEKLKVINVKAKLGARKSNFSSPESHSKPISLFTPVPVEPFNQNKPIKPIAIEDSLPPKLPKEGNESPPRKASNMNAALNAINHVYHSQFDANRFKNFIFSNSIMNKPVFFKFLEEIKTDVEVIRMIHQKEACPPKIALRQINKSNLFFTRQKSAPS